ncbi:MAG: SEC-C domain-containing protein [Labilithrix sp.]|nr:SEC-C domain-containing protein [Labilithrix sp.]
MLTVFDAVTTHRVCPCDCFRNLTVAERVAGIRAVYHLDDALRGWGYTPIYDVHGDLLFRQAQQKGDPAYRGVAVRFGDCIYRRLLGSLVHECLHAVCGDVTKANYGVLFGLPYGVPVDVTPSEEEAFLEPFNFGEARAWAGVWIVGKAMFAVDWSLRTARDVGTYCFTGGNALVAVPPGYRAVAHVDRTHHPERYYAKARKLEERARAWFAEDDNLAKVTARIDEAAAIGAKKRPRKYPEAETIARSSPKKIERNEPCVCGSAKKFKDCCGPRGTLEHFLPVNAR